MEAWDRSVLDSMSARTNQWVYYKVDLHRRSSSKEPCMGSFNDAPYMVVCGSFCYERTGQQQGTPMGSFNGVWYSSLFYFRTQVDLLPDSSNFTLEVR